MKLHSFLITRGSNITVNDVIGVRYGDSFQTAHELAGGGMGYTTVTATLVALLGVELDFSKLSACALGSTTSASIVLMLHVPAGSEGTLFLRRNAVQLETNRATIVDLGYTYNAPGALRTAEEMNAAVTNSFLVGIKSGIEFAEKTYT